MILVMQNAVPAGIDDRPIALRSVDRALADRYSTYIGEVRRLIEAGIAVMGRAETVSPKVIEIVREAGLSNQAFYRHFRSKDELLVAILDDGLRQLVGYLEHRMAGAGSSLDAIRRWVEGVLAQATDADAAARTRPFVRDSLRLAEQFPDEVRRSDEVLVTPLRRAITGAIAAGELPSADADLDSEAIYRLTMATMQIRLVQRRPPSAAEVDHLVAFILAGLDRPGGRRRRG
jgi:AcrR family transcriptional regulator